MLIDLLVALEAELDGITLPDDFRVTYTGVGKINATIAAMRVTQQSDCWRIVNFGTAGTLNPDLAGKLVRVATVIQRDMDARPLVELGVTPFDSSDAAAAIELGGDGVTLSTGDNFVTSPPELTSDIVDMEAYAIAKVARLVGVEFHCFKFVTDLADEDATGSWRENVSLGAARFLDACRQGRI